MYGIFWPILQPILMFSLCVVVAESRLSELMEGCTKPSVSSLLSCLGLPVFQSDLSARKVLSLSALLNGDAWVAAGGATGDRRMVVRAGADSYATPPRQRLTVAMPLPTKAALLCWVPMRRTTSTLPFGSASAIASSISRQVAMA